MSGLVKGLFGGTSKAEKRLQEFTPASFTSAGLSGRFNKATQTFSVTRSPELNSAIDNLVGAFEGRAAEFRGLRDQVKPGFGELTRTRIEGLRAARRKSVGNLRSELQKRRVLGSNFARDEVASRELQFDREEDRVRAESFLGELDATVKLIAAETDAAINAVKTVVDQFNLDSTLAANLSANASQQMQANLRAQGEAAAASEGGAFEFAGTIASALILKSDRRLKTNIVPIGERRGYRWYRFDYVRGGSGVGVMADEVPQEFVSYNRDGYAMVNYAALLGY